MAPVEGGYDLLAAAGPLPQTYGGGSPAAPPPRRKKKGGGNKTLLIVVGLSAGLGLLLLCGGMGVALLLPAVQAAREAAVRAKLREAAGKGAPIPVVLAPPSGSTPLAAPPLTGPIWQPDSSLDAQLPTRVIFDRYAIRLPAGFDLARPPETVNLLATKAHNWFWASPPRADGSRNIVSAEVLAFTVNPQRFEGDLEDELTQRLAASQNNLSQFAQDPPERGQLAGKQFARVRYSGVSNGHRNYGVKLLAIDGNRMLELEAVCREGPESEEYQLLEAAMLTFCEQ